jgi:lysozyme family protein
MPAPTYEPLREEYSRLWASMEIRASKAPDIDATAKKILAKKARYQAVAETTRVPWFMIGAIHAMECGLAFDRHLHCGDPLTARTYHVPAGRPKAPPANGERYTWAESAADALTLKGLEKIGEWPIERICYELERFNGFGYRSYHPSVLSPYLWSGTNHYSRGKYVADGKWSSTAVSGQSGAMAIIKRLAELDADVAAAIDSPVSAVIAEADEKIEDPALVFPKAETKPAANLGAVSRKASLAEKVRDWLLTLGIGGAGVSVADAAGLGKGYLDGIVQLLQDHGWAVFIVGCIAGGCIAALFLRWMHDDVKRGSYTPSGME